MKIGKKYLVLCGLLISTFSQAQNSMRETPRHFDAEDQRSGDRFIDGRKNRESIPMPKAMWAFFDLLEGFDSEETGLAMDILVNSVGLSEAKASALRTYAHSSISDISEMRSNLLSDLCGSPNRGFGVRTLRALDREVAAKRIEKTDAIPMVLNDGNAEVAVTDWVDENVRANMQILQFGDDEQGAAQSAREEIDIICKLAN